MESPKYPSQREAKLEAVLLDVLEAVEASGWTCNARPRAADGQVRLVGTPVLAALTAPFGVAPEFHGRECSPYTVGTKWPAQDQQRNNGALR